MQVDGVPAWDGAVKVDPETAQVTLDGATVAGGTVVLLLNKPAGYVTSTRDPRDPTVMELLPPAYRRRVTPVGRLDKDTEGLLLFTDDGELAHRLISPTIPGAQGVLCPPRGAGDGRGCGSLCRGIGAGRRDGVPSGQAGTSGTGREPGDNLRGKIPSGPADAGFPGMPVTYLERRAEGQLTLDGVPRGHFRVFESGGAPPAVQRRGDAVFWSFSLKTPPQDWAKCLKICDIP